MARYYLARSLRALTNELGGPDWPTVGIGDGWIGDASHNARKSDHNPDWSSGGVVRAVDIGIKGRNAKAILDAAIGDHRAWYVIHKGTIWSRTYGWKPRRYTGSNPHNHHIHISIRHTKTAETDAGPWFPRNKKKAPAKKQGGSMGSVNLSNVRNQFLIALGKRSGKKRRLPGVKHIQRALNEQYGAGLKVDGWVGPSTLNAYRRHERATAGTGRPAVPDLKSLRRLQRRFKISRGRG